MSHPQPPQRQPTSDETQRYVNTLHNTAIAALVAGPILILIPPRKLDFYTFGLCGATLFSANYLIREQTGRSIFQHITQPRLSHEALSHSSIPPTEQANLQRELQNARQELRRVKGETENESESVSEQVRSQRDVWKAQREQEIKDDVEEGKGFGDMIMDQIWEVWNWGKPGEDDGENGG